jgi:hypothetical protein
MVQTKRVKGGLTWKLGPIHELVGIFVKPMEG